MVNKSFFNFELRYRTLLVSNKFIDKDKVLMKIDTNFKHNFKTVSGVNWHWVEVGDGDPVVLLHGIPESWKCWKHQMPTEQYIVNVM